MRYPNVEPNVQVVIVMARCSLNGREFGIRFEETTTGHWTGDWAFGLKGETAKKEGYDRTEVRGDFRLAPTYPGCPHCGAASVFRCECGKVACWDGSSNLVECVWCGKTGTLGGMVDCLNARADR